ncbi:MAG: Pirin domain protein [Bradyrhizobium sp.]|jgi:redox-sensitive bicupin YhaK (pirin superfamily)|nr:Pirin domain protein [Bradyrhizobium sp.]
MNQMSAPTNDALRPIVHQTSGHRQGPITRLMSPSDLGQVLKPFVFLDLFDMRGSMVESFDLHPHSGIATITYVMAGSVGYEDTDGFKGVLPEGGLEWMKAGGGAWHGGGPGSSDHIQGFQLWIALPPAQEHDASESIYLPASEVPADGPVTVLLGQYGSARATIAAPSPLNYLAVRLKAGETWTYQPPAGHSVCWVALATGQLLASGKIAAGQIAVFAASEEAITFEALSDCAFVLGSAIPHAHDLVLGYYSVHSSVAALRTGEARIVEVGSKRGVT